MVNSVKKANRKLAEKKQENSFWCCVRDGSSKRWHLSLDVRKEPAPWRAGGAESQLERTAGSVGITEGGLMCLDSSLVNSDEIKAGLWGGLVVYIGVSEALCFNLDSSQCWSPKAHKKGSGFMDVSWNMVGTLDSLRLRSMDASSWDLKNFGVLLWRKSDLDVVSVFCGSCRQLPTLGGLRQQI